MINIKMEYTKKTLFIKLSGVLNNETLLELKRKVFAVIDDYDIKNVILNGKNLIINDNKLLNLFRSTYKNKYNGRLTIKI